MECLVLLERAFELGLANTKETEISVSSYFLFGAPPIARTLAVKHANDGWQLGNSAKHRVVHRSTPNGTSEVPSVVSTQGSEKITRCSFTRSIGFFFREFSTQYDI